MATDLGQWGAAAVAGNLPYYAATPIIEKTLADFPALQRAVFLVQKEVAARLSARPRTRDYGYLSVQTQLLAEAEALFDVRPSAFRPPPKVDSTLIRLRPHNRAAELQINDTPRFLRFVKICFHHKRKTLRNNLAAAYGKDIIAGLPEAGKRAEELTLLQFAELYHRLVPS
jgi:16S rRNA (adenine1518-N6/adenine1519-N6)-dimethyltransferase